MFDKAKQKRLDRLAKKHYDPKEALSEAESEEVRVLGEEMHNAKILEAFEQSKLDAEKLK